MSMSKQGEISLQPWEKLAIVADAPGVKFYPTNRIELGLVHDRFLVSLAVPGATAAALRDMSNMASGRAAVQAERSHQYISRSDRDLAGARLVLSTLHSFRDFSENAFFSKGSLTTLQSRLEALPKDSSIAEALEIDPQDPRSSKNLSFVLPFARYVALRSFAAGSGAAFTRGNNVLQAIENRSEAARLRPGATKRVEDRYTTHNPLHKIVLREVGRMVSSYTVERAESLLPEVIDDTNRRGIFHFALLQTAAAEQGTIGELANLVMEK